MARESLCVRIKHFRQSMGGRWSVGDLFPKPSRRVGDLGEEHSARGNKAVIPRALEDRFGGAYPRILSVQLEYLVLMGRFGYRKSVVVSEVIA